MTAESPTDLVTEHLDEALSADDPTEKNFHVRTALQALEIDG